jgi:hypothetical protein
VNLIPLDRPCNPALHYTVMREALIAKGFDKVRKGRYFTLFAPRQTGKTTYFQLLLEAVRSEGFTPIWISFEKLKTVNRDIFYQDLNHQLHQELAEHQIKLEHTITNQIHEPYSIRLLFGEQPINFDVEDIAYLQANSVIDNMVMLVYWCRYIASVLLPPFVRY